MQRKRVPRKGQEHQEDGTTRKTKKKVSDKETEEKGTELKKKNNVILRKLGFSLHPDKNDTGSTVKRRKKPAKKPSTERARKAAPPVWNPDKKVHFNVEKPHVSIPLKGDPISDVQKKVFVKFTTEIVKRSPPEFSLEFMSKVKTYAGQPMERKIFDSHPTKNRYKDVICNDITRVILNDGGDGDYIHANYVNGLTVPYILTQGPTPSTVTDFWRMIVHTKTSYIVMLCDLIEEGKQKCFAYYPDKVNETVTFGVWTITCSGLDEKDQNIYKRTLAVKNTETGKEHNLKHLHTKSWPDKSVPNSHFCLLRMLFIVRQAPAPVTVHCSAGIGRTGTFVAVEACLQTLADGKELDLMATVKALRNSRAGSVQVDIQYMTLVQMIITYGKDNGYWSDTDLDDRVELLCWNIEQFIQTRGKVEHVLAAPSTPNVPQAPTPAPPQTPARASDAPTKEDKKVSKRERKCQHKKEEEPKEQAKEKDAPKEHKDHKEHKEHKESPAVPQQVPAPCCEHTPAAHTPAGALVTKDSSESGEELDGTPKDGLKEALPIKDDEVKTVIPLTSPVPPSTSVISPVSTITSIPATPSTSPPLPPLQQPSLPQPQPAMPMKKSKENQEKKVGSMEKKDSQPLLANPVKKSAEKDKEMLRKNRSEYFM